MTATGYVSTTGDSRKVSKAGDTMTGELVLPDSSPDAALNAASKGYVDTVAATKATGAASSTDNALVRFDGTTGKVLQNCTVIVGDDGSVTITGNLTDAGDLLVRNSNTTPTKGYRFRTSGGALDTESGGEDWYWSTYPNADFTGTQNTYMRWDKSAAIIHMLAEIQCKATAFGARVHTLNGANNTLGFHGADPIAKQTVSGAKGGNAALASLITALANLGLITDGTSA
jgi:hypothetical protein